MSQPATRTGLRPWRSEGSGEVVGGGFGQPERQDVGQGGGVLVEVEDLSGEQRQHRPLLAKGAADQGVDGDEEHELGQVLPQAQRDARRGSGLPAGGVLPEAIDGSCRCSVRYPAEPTAVSLWSRPFTRPCLF